MKTHIETANTFRSMLGLETNSVAANKSSAIEVPVDEAANIILEYTTMNGSISVKQADVVLIDDFLDYPNQYSLSDLNYYAGKQSDDGPGMTYGVFSVVANAFSLSGCSAYTYGIHSSHPYVRAPWFQYSEQLIDNYSENGGTHPAYPFLTGMGGANRVAVFGYLGLRLRLDAVNVDPSLPPQIAHLAYRTFYWQGYAIAAASNATHTTLRRIPGKTLASASAAYAAAPIPVTVGTNSTEVAHTLPASGGAVVLPNRAIAEVETWPGNVAQCVPATSDQDFGPGLFPFAANDGAVSTRWQPVSANVSASITVDLGAAAAGQVVSGFRFDWAQAPPRVYSVAFANTTDAREGVVNVTSDDGVEISSPYDAAAASLIRPYESNTTNVTLSEPVYAGRYAILTIRGNQASSGDDGVGASVAEFGVIVGANNTGNGTGDGKQPNQGLTLNFDYKSVLIGAVLMSTTVFLI